MFVVGPDNVYFGLKPSILEEVDDVFSSEKHRAYSRKYSSTVAPQGCTGDEGRSPEVGLQEQISNRLTLLGVERPQVVSR
jgi:hypothetical protein